jgi:hypothetical protein
MEIEIRPGVGSGKSGDLGDCAIGNDRVSVGCIAVRLGLIGNGQVYTVCLLFRRVHTSYSYRREFA